MTTYTIEIDTVAPLAREPSTGHNRWHEDIEPVLTAKVGDTVVFETRDSVDGQLSRESVIKDLDDVSVGRVHPLTGPVSILGAEPGDLLKIEILDVDPDPWDHWGYTRLLPGFGFLREDFPDPYLVHWSLQGREYAESKQLPGVRIRSNPFPGIIGVAPSAELRARITEREANLAARGGIAAAPEKNEAVPAGRTIADEGLRTYPPREIGGNLDVRQLTAGTTVLLPVWIEGANVSVGDVHYAQGDGEVCGNGIEIKARVALRFDVEKGGARCRRIRDPQFCFQGRSAPDGLSPARFFATTGIGLRRNGANESEDVTLAARNATINMISHLETRGFDRNQAYAICSCAVDLRLSQVVNIPNPLVSAILPLDIFH